MRISLLVVVWVIGPALALAKPKVAVAPIAGDDRKIVRLVGEAVAEYATVTSGVQVGKALKELEISDPDNAKAAKKLRAKLKVDAVIYGKLEHDGAKRTLHLSIYTRGKKPDKFELEFKQSTSKTFRLKLRDELKTRLDPDENGKDDDDDDKPKQVAEEPKKHVVEEPPPKKHIVDEDGSAGRGSRAGGRGGSIDEDKPVKHVARRDDDDSTTVHKRRKHRDEDEPERNKLTQPDVIATLGGGVVHRSLTYGAMGATPTPTPVGTAAAGLQFDGELYGSATESLQSAAAFGVYASVSRSVALSIAIPGGSSSAPISEGSYALGLRYRFKFGTSSLAVGAAYWNQFYIADRGSLTSPTALNMADTDYMAVAPGALLRLAASPTIAVAFQVDVPLLLKSGPITDADHFGAASSIAFVLQGGLDIALAPHYGLHVGLLVDQVSFSFKAGGLASATDRTISGTAAFAVAY